MTTSSITNDPRRTILPCHDITLPNNSNPTNSFFRRRTQQQVPSNNGQLDKSSSTSSTKSSLIDENSIKIPPTTFSLLRQHSSPTNPHTKIDKSTYDNLTNATLQTDTTIVSSSHLERKSSYPLNKKANRHVTNESLKSDAYDNYPEKNGYDNYPLVRKTPHNEFEGNFNDRFLRLIMFIDLERQSSSSTIGTPRSELNTKRSQSIHLKNPFTHKTSSISDENKRSGNTYHRSNKSSTTNKDPLCNLNAASCSPLNEHVRYSHLSSIFHSSSFIRSFSIRIVKFINNHLFFVISVVHPCKHQHFSCLINNLDIIIIPMLPWNHQLFFHRNRHLIDYPMDEIVFVRNNHVPIPIMLISKSKVMMDHYVVHIFVFMIHKNRKQQHFLRHHRVVHHHQQNILRQIKIPLFVMHIFILNRISMKTMNISPVMIHYKAKIKVLQRKNLRHIGLKITKNEMN